MGSGVGDPRLAEFLAARSDADAEAALARIFDASTDRLITDSVRRGLVGSSRATDTEDVVSETRVRLIRRLWALRQEGLEPIEDFTAYVSTTATRTCYAHLRERFPARTRFKNQVRYGILHHPDTVLEAVAGEWRCRSNAIRRAPVAGSIEQLIDSPASFLAKERIDRGLPLPQLVAAVLARLDVPIELDRLVDSLASTLGIAEARAVTQHPDAEADAIDSVPDPSPDRLQELSAREELRSLWREVVTLPPNQRIALLLNLRDPDGGAAVHVLPLTGVVSRGELAGVLEISPRELDELWDQLPLDDLKIAGRLGLTRQQVINLRKSARARLARRTDRV